MKRVATALFSFIVLASFLVNADAQVLSRANGNLSKMTLTGPVATPGSATTVSGTASSPVLITSNKGAQPLAIQTDAISYFEDTTNGNWWLSGYHWNSPFLHINPSGDTSQDSIGDIGINVGTNANGSEHDTTAFDTTYSRIMALRVSVPTDIKTQYLDSASLTFVPVAFGPNDVIRFLVVPIIDVQFTRGGTPVGTYPIPDLFAQSTNGTYIAKDSIKASQMTVGQLNTITVPFGHKRLGTRTQFGIVLLVDGPNFTTDTVAYQMDANISPTLGSSLIIDTDGTQNPPSADGNTIPMRTYVGNLDGGHLILTTYNHGVATLNPSSVVGGIGQFFFDIPTAADPTQAFESNLVLTTYISGTAAAVNEGPVSQNSLDGNYPNPVGTTSAINYNLDKSGPVTLQVYSALGEQVGTVVNTIQGAGEHSVMFNAGTLPNGIYYYKLQSGDFTATRTMVISR